MTTGNTKHEACARRDATEFNALAGEMIARLETGVGGSPLEELQRFAEKVETQLPILVAADEVALNALNELPARQREALLLHLGGFSYSEIAARQGRSPGGALRDLVSAYVRLAAEQGR